VLVSSDEVSCFAAGYVKKMAFFLNVTTTILSCAGKQFIASSFKKNLSRSEDQKVCCSKKNVWFAFVVHETVCLLFVSV